MSHLKVEGIVSVYRHPPGVTLCHLDEAELVASGKNLVVDNGLEWIAKKLGHLAGTPPLQVGGTTVSSLDDLEVAEVQLGNNATPAAPDASDTALSDLTPLATYTSLTVTYPTATSVRWAATIAPNTLAGEGITEIGLFLDVSATKILLARRVFSPAVVIAPAQGYTVTYDIALSAS